MDSGIKEIAEKFLKEEKLPMTNALAFASLGLTKSTGDIAEIAYNVGFSGHPYNEERKRDIADSLGDLLFYWHVLALTSGISGQEIIHGWISTWLTKNKIADQQEFRISIREMLKHMKHRGKDENHTPYEK